MAVPILGITGGIATGKSTFAALLSRLTGAQLFDADHAARELLDTDEKVRRQVRLTFGDGIFGPAGEPDRAGLRELVFADAEKRRALEAILHPAIRERWVSLAAGARAAGSAGKWLAVDIPLLFETQSEGFFDAVIVVACRASTQMERLLNNRKLDRDIAGKMISAQMGLEAKIAKARHVVWNDGPARAMEEQAALLAARLKQHHG
ncbi:MAG TPA: dephospho-CoA kinase [Chthoniobacteraceae bacterium]|nr:dephospho-CoA kinase [Chthoniobacteraceae bacterium]